MGKRAKRVSPEKRQKVLQASKQYGVNYLANHFTLSKSEIYKILRQEKGKPAHFAELSITGSLLALNLRRYWDNLCDCTDLGNPKEGLGVEVYGGAASEEGGPMFILEEVDRSVALNLLYHLKDEFPELTDIKDWAELPVGKITNDFIERLRLKANHGDFMGKCPGCPT